VGYQFIQTRVEDGVFVLTLNRPEKANAITTQMDLEWLHALQDAEADPDVRVILQHGNGRMFTAGHDLHEVGTIIQELGDNASDWSAVYERIWPEGSPLDFTTELSKPTVSAVHGQVVGQGVYQVLATDIVLAAPGTVFNMEVARTGGAAGVAALCGLLPVKLVNELAYVGRLSAEALLAAGAINRIVEADELVSASLEVSKSIARVHPSSLAAHKSAMKRTLASRGVGDFRSGFEAIKTSHGNAEDNAFWSLAGKQGVKGALAWRDENFGPATSHA
jgi:enoyl-CoA hydratase/carnithine racemase